MSIFLLLSAICERTLGLYARGKLGQWGPKSWRHTNKMVAVSGLFVVVWNIKVRFFVFFVKYKWKMKLSIAQIFWFPVSTISCRNFIGERVLHAGHV